MTLLRSSVRGLLREAERLGESGLEAELRAVLRRDDDYRAPGKPPCDWEDREAARALIDELATDVSSCLRVLEGRELDERVARAGELCAAVVGQDLEQDEGGRFVIARRVARDRIISTVDPDARHGRKSSAHGFDGYKGHLAIDPESELITHTTVTAGNVADGDVAEELITDLLEDAGEHDDSRRPGCGGEHRDGDRLRRFGLRLGRVPVAAGGARGRVPLPHSESDRTASPFQQGAIHRRPGEGERHLSRGGDRADSPRLRRPGDRLLPRRLQPLSASRPVHHIACGPHRRGRDPREASLAAARARQEAPGWLSGYRTVRSIVERKVAHTTRPQTRRPGCPRPGAASRSMPTTTCSPPPSTWRGWRRWGCTPHQPGGRWQRPRRRDGGGATAREPAPGSPGTGSMPATRPSPRPGPTRRYISLPHKPWPPRLEFGTSVLVSRVANAENNRTEPRRLGPLSGGLGRNWNEHRMRFISHKTTDQILE